ncbi:MAG: LysM peptidoglycan-binding domain-containing protein [Polaribacter sp.]|nr:LysM peptidoglycan-binding domain-containing protein [Polaribacter sp.]
MKHIKIWLILALLSFSVSCGQQNRYIQYKVKAGETMSTIAEKLNMKTKDLLRLNPDFTETPKPNSFIIVPENKYEFFRNQQVKNDVVIEEVDTNNPSSDREKLIASLKEKFLIYEVKKGDTFYSLEKKFNVTRGELLLLNPELKEGLKENSILKIKEILEESAIKKPYFRDEIRTNSALKVALMLPLRSDAFGYDSISPKEIFLKNGSLVNIATDFYLGAEIAVDSLRNSGVDIDLSVFDTGTRKSNRISSIISNQNLNANDVIIGPFYSEEAQMVASAVTIPLVFPMYSANQSEFKNSNIIKAAPDKKIFKDVLIDYINDTFDQGNLILVGDQTATNSIKNELRVSNGSIRILTPQNGMVQKGRFLEILKPNTKNWIIIASNNEVIISDVVNSLISLPSETKVNVFTFDKGSVYDKIDNLKLGKIGFTYVSEEFVDETSESSRSFTKLYQEKNNTLPSFYATKGFDITYDILVRLSSGKRLQATFREGATIRVDTKFDYKNNDTFENEGVFILQINRDLTITKLK